mmetsp:Transcript_4073/g.4722  ORF Transcript_4073/g.4722 Transcript_4073/m.4722 type:complete len:337 (-) Transcript_4073:464-1474(-)|eukprot:CAMPEP_0204834172 /NCGR_PEP_ID=MMETSP1346-20131115/19020_1 /ASSEMBLY_ACC=CAM_ASM_000771 /TAXON_ID=215587 /ORGANISM="Aplanochytrium stocchinoi, Strain GSBS06" /LENGTH=336 /DNA_ID=CAMNT_0051967281 /DNA_START=78 /DNA_END=1088 /DNA_ORIENTATION=+
MLVEDFESLKDLEVTPNSIFARKRGRKTSLFGWVRNRFNSKSSSSSAQESDKTKDHWANRHFKINIDLNNSELTFAPNHVPPVVEKQAPSTGQQLQTRLQAHNKAQVKFKREAPIGKQSQFRLPAKQYSQRRIKSVNSAGLVSFENALDRNGEIIIFDLSLVIFEKLTNNGVLLFKDGFNPKLKEDFSVFFGNLVRHLNVYYQTGGGKTTAGVNVAAHTIVYIGRLLNSKNYVGITEKNIRTFVTVGMLVAAKVAEDIPLSNSYWASVCDDMSLEKLNTLEMVFCGLLDFELFVKESEYEKVLVEGAAATGPTSRDYKRTLHKQGDLKIWELDALI